MLALRRFSRQLRALRTSHDLSQEALAERAGVSAAYVGMLERGERNPPLTTVHALADALGTDIATLLAGETSAGEVLQIGAGEHVLHLYRSEGERREVAQALLGRGPAAYLGPAPSRRPGKGLRVLDPAEHFLGRAGKFDVDRAVGRLAAVIEELGSEGPGVLVSAPPAQVIGDARGLIAYERRLDEICSLRSGSCLCQYPAARLGAAGVLDLLSAHGWLVTPGADQLQATRLGWRPARLS